MIGYGSLWHALRDQVVEPIILAGDGTRKEISGSGPRSAAIAAMAARRASLCLGGGAVWLRFAANYRELRRALPGTPANR
jgi:hypothetical protein